MDRSPRLSIRLRTTKETPVTDPHPLGVPPRADEPAAGWYAPTPASGPAPAYAPYGSDPYATDPYGDGEQRADAEAPAEKPRRRGRTVALAALAAVLALVAGFGIGTVTSDPTASDEYAELDARLAEVVGERDAAITERDTALADLETTSGELTTTQEAVTDVTAERDQALADLDEATAGHDEREAELDERQVGLDERAAELDTRETEVADRETAVGDRETELEDREVAVGTAEETVSEASFGPGTQLVGTDVAPGTYRATGPVDGCYWERLSGTSGEFGDIIANDFTYDPGSVVTIAASDVAFSSNGCGSWEPVQ